MRRASWTTGVAAAAALVLAFCTPTSAAPPKPVPPAPTRPEPGDAPPWVADELRILRAEVESLRQRPEPSPTGDLAALRAEVARLAAAQAELERRLGATPSSSPPTVTPERSVGGGVAAALVFLGLGIALGWVASRLTQRWRDRRQRIRV